MSQKHPGVKFGRVAAFALALSVSSHPVATAAVTTSHLPDEAAADAVVERDGGAYRFAAEARIGRPGDWELGLRCHPSVVNDGTLLTANFDPWPNRQAVTWTVAYDAARRSLTTKLRFAGQSSTLAWSSTSLVADFNELFVRTRAANANTSIVVSNLVLDGEAVAASSSSVNTGGDARDVLRLQGANLADGFVLTATVRMSWTGPKPRNSELDAQLWGAKVVTQVIDTTPPTLRFLQPAAGSLSRERQPTIAVEYADAGSGVDLSRLDFTLDGNVWSGRVAPGPTGFSYTLPVENALGYGEHFASVEVYDLAGNRTHQTVTWDVDPDPPMLTAFEPANGSDTLIRPPLRIRGGWRDFGGTMTRPEAVKTWLDGALVPCEVELGRFVCTVQDPTAGAHQFRVEVTDPAGNTVSGETNFVLRVDREAPVLTLDGPAGERPTRLQEVMIAGQALDDSGEVRVEVNGELVPRTAEGRFSALVPLPTPARLGRYSLRVTAADAAGRETQQEVRVTVDSSPPHLRIYGPQSGQLVNHSTVRVRGFTTDETGIQRVEVGTTTAALVDRQFEAEVALVPGDNLIPVRAVDGVGNVAEVLLRLTRVDLPDLTIQWPNEGDRFAVPSIEVRGTTSAGATVQVNGQPAVIAGAEWSLPVLTLAPGGTVVNVVATSPQGTVTTASRHVVRDVEPPHLAVSTPREGAVLFEDSVWVSGLVNDVVPGTVHGATVSVSVNGITAAVANRSFAAQVPLESGANTLRVAAVDAAGNHQETEVRVTRQSPAGRRLERVSGDRQSGEIGTALPQLLRVRAVDGTGQPAAGVNVLFRVVGNDGHLGSGARARVVTTGNDGLAETSFHLGRRAGTATQRVDASAVGFGEPLNFLADAHFGPPRLLVLDAGNQQTGVTGRPLARPLAVAVVDAGSNRVPGVPLTFRVTAGGGTFADGTTETEVWTDADGRASVSFHLGPEELIAGHHLEVFLSGTDPDEPGAPVVAFTASAKAAGWPADTTLSGLVLDNQNNPVPGVGVSVAGTALHTTAGVDGRFRLVNVPPGELKLHVDGSTTSRPGTWPPLEFDLAMVPGRDNAVGMPIFLLPLDLEHGVWVDETTGGTLTLPELPGLALEIAPGSVTFPDGARSGLISVTPVHSDKVPMTPNFGQQPRLILTIQPAGAHFDPPARLTLPNVEGLPAGSVTEMYSFDHDLGSFVSIGPATVSDDGERFTSNLGVGILKAGWHCGGNPGASGTAHDCPPCTVCDRRRCVPGCPGGAPQGAEAGSEVSLRAACGCQDDLCLINESCANGQCQGEPASIGFVGASAEGSTRPIVLREAPVTFEALALDVRCPSVTYLWDFGDGTTGAGASPQHAYQEKGKFKVVVKAICGESCAMVMAELEVRVVEIKLKEVTYSGPTFNAVLQDTGETYAPPHWQDNSSPLDGDGTDENGDRSFPVSFRRDSHIHIEAGFEVDPRVDFGERAPLVRINGDLFSLQPKELKQAGGQLQLSVTPLDGKLHNVIDFLAPLRLEWEVKTAQSGVWRPAGTTENRVYVTLNQPTPQSQLYETVLDISCGVAQGSSEPQDAVNLLWSEFGGPIPGVKRKPVDGFNRTDGVEMRYWAEQGQPGNIIAATFCATLPSMLDPRIPPSALGGVGTCSAWSDLFLETCKVQGISDLARVTIRPRPGKGLALVIKEAGFVGSGSTPAYCGPYRYTASEVIDLPGLPGQGNPNPPPYFNLHFIARVFERYFDPSYGSEPYVGFPADQAAETWAERSLVGFGATCDNRPVFRPKLQELEIEFSEPLVQGARQR